MNNRILVVDDDAAMVRTLSDVLRLKGWIVETARAGRAAVDAAVVTEYHAVVMDFQMPDMDGMSAFLSIRSFRPATRFILMSAYVAHEVRALAEREGVTVLGKPFDVDALVQILAEDRTRPRPVLVVDSDATFLSSLTEELTIRGFTAVACHSVGQASEVMSHRAPAAVLLHVNPDAAHGIGHALRRFSPAAAFVPYSGKADADLEIRRALPAEWLCTYLHKTFALEQVTAVLERAGRRAPA